MAIPCLSSSKNVLPTNPLVTVEENKCSQEYVNNNVVIVPAFEHFHVKLGGGRLRIKFIFSLSDSLIRHIVYLSPMKNANKVEFEDLQKELEMAKLKILKMDVNKLPL